MRNLIYLLLLAISVRSQAKSSRVCSIIDASAEIATTVTRTNNAIRSLLPIEKRGKFNRVLKRALSKKKPKGRVPFCFKGKNMANAWGVTSPSVTKRLQDIISKCLGGAQNIDIDTNMAGNARKLILRGEGGIELSLDLDGGYYTVVKRPQNSSSSSWFMSNENRFMVKRDGSCSKKSIWNQAVENAREVMNAKGMKVGSKSYKAELKKIAEIEASKRVGGFHNFMGNNDLKSRLSKLPCPPK